MPISRLSSPPTHTHPLRRYLRACASNLTSELGESEVACLWVGVKSNVWNKREHHAHRLFLSPRGYLSVLVKIPGKSLPRHGRDVILQRSLMSWAMCARYCIDQAAPRPSNVYNTKNVRAANNVLRTPEMSLGKCGRSLVCLYWLGNCGRDQARQGPLKRERGKEKQHYTFLLPVAIPRLT